MIRIEVFLPKNNVMKISEALKKIDVGGLTVVKKRGRGQHPPPEIHAGKGSMIFQPQFTQKYVIELIISDEKKDEAVKLIRENSERGKIFISPVLETIDIKTGNVNGEG